MRKCMLDNSYVTGAKDRTGGLASYAANVTTSLVRNSTISGTSYVGGILGSRGGSATGCAVEKSTIEGSGDYIGGIIGGSTDYSFSPYNDAVMDVRLPEQEAVLRASEVL